MGRPNTLLSVQNVTTHLSGENLQNIVSVHHTVEAIILGAMKTVNVVDNHYTVVHIH